MNFKSILVVGLSFATIGLSLPAHADDTATVINSSQDAIVTGTGNRTTQVNTTSVENSSRGRRTSGNTGTAVTNRQGADVQGSYNDTTQINATEVINRRNSR
ncbi:MULTISPECIES: hypothetical protein [unclassified Chamaesiphon]|uniref:hypothetical protein n=1 Tax=unclassified Chamaesiphon TaxID=2620921 RepID=UPI00286BD30F|nr:MULTISPECIES: hypothetical protein [unclassified Chamaesiphon]